MDNVSELHRPIEFTIDELDNAEIESASRLAGGVPEYLDGLIERLRSQIGQPQTCERDEPKIAEGQT